MGVVGDSKLSSILLFVLSYPFAGRINTKLNAVGISSFPDALRAYKSLSNEDIKKDIKRKATAYLISLFHSSVVVAGLFHKYPRIIQAHAIVGIGMAVRESIAVRKEKEEQARLEAERRAAQKARGGITSISRWINDWMFDSLSLDDESNDTMEEESKSDACQQPLQSTNRSNIQEKSGLRKRFGFSSRKDNAQPDSAITQSQSSSDCSSVTNTSSLQSNTTKPPTPKGYKTVKAQSAVKRTKKIIKGRRDSTTDDIIWGVFQASFVLLDQTIGKALAYAWLLFLLTILEEALLNPKLNKEQRMKRFGWILATGYFSGRLVLPR